MTLEQKKLKLELSRVEVARMEFELKIEEKLEEIERYKNLIQIQLAKEVELKERLRGIDV